MRGDIGPLEAARFRLRCPGAAGAAFVQDLLGDAEVRRSLGAVPLARGAVVALGYLDLPPRDCVWEVETKAEGEPVGLVLLTGRAEEAAREVPHIFRAAVWGRGYATEPVGRVMAHGVEDLKMGHLVAETLAADAASCRLLLRLGMREARRVVPYGAEQFIFSSRGSWRRGACRKTLCELERRWNKVGKWGWTT